MHKTLSKKLRLKSSQIDRFKQELEEESWLYSESLIKRSAACCMYSLPLHILVTLPLFYFLSNS